MYNLIIFLPLIGAVLSWILGNRFSSIPTYIVSISCLFLSMIISWIAFYDIAILKNNFEGASLPWINSGEFRALWEFNFDTLSCVMFLVVNTVSAMVHLYSVGYMSHDKSKARFMAYLSFFTFAMLMLVSSNNLLQLFFGWEGVGVASYLLIGFWYNKKSATSAAVKAFLVNRVGDLGFILGLIFVYTYFDTIMFERIFELAPSMIDENIFFLDNKLANSIKSSSYHILKSSKESTPNAIFFPSTKRSLLPSFNLSILISSFGNLSSQSIEFNFKNFCDCSE